MPKSKHPFYSEPTNATRRDLAKLTLAYYLQTKGEKPETGTSDIVDLVTDLLHLADTMQDRIPKQVCDTALMHFFAEASQ